MIEAEREWRNVELDSRNLIVGGNPPDKWPVDEKVDELENKYNAAKEAFDNEERERALETLPKGLEETYDRLLSRIESEEGSRLIFKMMKWMLFARRPLKLEELREAIAFDIDDTFLDPTKFPHDMNRLIQACGNLIRVAGESKIVYFSHYTVQQYLLSPRASKAELQFTPREAENTIGELCVTYLSFSNFETRLVKRAPEYEIPLTPLTNAINKNPTLPLGQGGSGRIAIRLNKSLRRRSAVLPDISFNEHLQTQLKSRHSDVKNRYELLDYVADNWLWHTRYFLHDLPDTSKSLRRFRSLLLSESFIPRKPWTTTTVLNTDTHPQFPQEYLAWLDNVRDGEASINMDVKGKRSITATFQYQDESSKNINTTIVPQKIQIVMGEERLVKIVSSSAANRYDSDAEKDEEMNSEASSIFSKETTGTGTYASSVPESVVYGAEDELVTMLMEDEILEPLYKIAAAKLSPERFEGNFARLLKIYAHDRREGASDSL